MPAKQRIMKLLFVFAILWLQAKATSKDMSSSSSSTLESSSSKSIYCNNEFQQCANTNLKTRKDLECFAYQGCYDSNIKAMNIISCKGYQSCKKAKLFANQDIYCTAEQSCSDSDQIKTKNGSIFCSSIDSCSKSKLKSNKNIHCSGKESCNSSYVSAAEDIYCSGVQSCFNNSKNVIQSGANVFCSADKACSLSTINASKSIRCSDSKSCFQSILNTNETSVYCDGRESCRYAAITTAYLDCSGDKSCYNSTLRKIGPPYLGFFCVGQQSCEFSNIYSPFYLWNDGRFGLAFANIYGGGLIGSTGELGLRGAYIDTADSPFVELFMSGYGDGNDASLVCRNNSVCAVYCRGLNSCEAFTMYCMIGSVCLYECEDGAICPTVIENVTINSLDAIIASAKVNRDNALLMESDKQEFDVNYIMDNIQNVKKITANDVNDINDDVSDINSVVEINSGSFDGATSNAGKITFVLLAAFLIVVGWICYYGFYKNDKNYESLK